MEYMSAREAAEKWGMSLRYVQQLLHEGKITGARKYGVSWMIPSDCVYTGRSPASDADAPSGCGFAFLPILHMKTGDRDEARALALCRNTDEQTLLKAQIALFRSDIPLAHELAVSLYDSASEPLLRLGCLTVLALCALYSGDMKAWNETESLIENLAMPAELTIAREYSLLLLKLSLHGNDSCPEWIEKGDYSSHPAELYPLARYLYIKNMYIKWREVDLVAVSEPLLSECHREKSCLASILIHVLTAAAYNDLGKQEMSQEHLLTAAAIAQPMGFVSPFIDYYHTLARVMDDCLKDRYPQLLSVLNKKGRMSWETWAKLYNDLWSRPMVQGLTPRELEAVRLIKRGLTTAEVAKRMNISKNSVKKYLNVAYAKMNVNKKSQLHTLIHT